MNALAGAEAYVDDRLFATLDTTTRRLQVPGHKILLSDTVGFIRRLPHGLIASFRSTLDVANEADALVVVADASDPRVRVHIEVVRETLAEIGAQGTASILVLNKCDRACARDAMVQLMSEFPSALAVSARKGEGLEALKVAIAAKLA